MLEWPSLPFLLSLISYRACGAPERVRGIVCHDSRAGAALVGPGLEGALFELNCWSLRLLLASPFSSNRLSRARRAAGFEVVPTLYAMARIIFSIQLPTDIADTPRCIEARAYFF